jgi:hypothetical protein
VVGLEAGSRNWDSGARVQKVGLKLKITKYKIQNKWAGGD